MRTATDAPDATGVFVHEGLFYRGTEEYLAGTVPFVAEAVAAGESVLVAVPGANLELIRSALDGAAAGVRFADMAVAGRNPGRIIPWVLHAFLTEHAGRRSRVVGEPIWAGRTADEYPACAQHEAMINEAFAGFDATILCPYDAERLGSRALADAAATHPVLVDGGRRAASAEYAPLELVEAYNQPLPEPDGAVAALAFGPGALGAVRRFVTRHAERAGLSAGRVDDLVIAVNELAANTVTHGGGTGTVRVWLTPAAIICEVRDPGRITEPLAGRVLPAMNSEGGRGLVIVNHLCDLVRLYTGESGTTIRLTMRR
jgi:anti-sigma regulatory factor (Ser/Thr protein kinase)